MKTTSLELSRRLNGKLNIKTEESWYKARTPDSFENAIFHREGDYIRTTSGLLWEPDIDTDYYAYDQEIGEIPAYTTDELMEWLPARIKTNDDDLACLEIHKHRGYGVRYVYYRNGIGYILGGYGKTTSRFNNQSLPEALGLLAEYLVDNGIYKGKE